MDCKTCKENRDYISRHVHESDLDRLERINKRWFIAWLITFLLFVGTNAGWIYYESQWQVEQTEVSQDVNTGEGDAYVAGIGDVYYGESQADSQKEIQKP